MNELHQALKELVKSFQKVEDICVRENIYELGNNYPFHHSFDEMTLEVDTWVDDFIQSCETS